MRHLTLEEALAAHRSEPPQHYARRTTTEAHPHFFILDNDASPYADCGGPVRLSAADARSATDLARQDPARFDRGVFEAIPAERWTAVFGVRGWRVQPTYSV